MVNMFNKLNIGKRTGYKVHVIILGKNCDYFTMCAVIDFHAYLTQIHQLR